MTNQQLYFSVGLPCVLIILAWITNRSDLKEIATELKNFRIETAKDLGKIDTRLSVIETKMAIAPTSQKMPAEPAMEERKVS